MSGPQTYSNGWTYADRYPLTDRQRECLVFILTHVKDKGFAPSMREIGRAMGIASTNGVSEMLRALERKGFVERRAMGSRCIRVTRLP